MATNIPEGLTPEMVEQLVSSPGETILFSGFGQPTVIKAETRVDTSNPARKGFRPEIEGNTTDVTGGRISHPSSGLAGKLAAGDAKLRADAAAREAEQDIHSAMSDPVKTNDRLAYFERAVKRQAKQIAELQKVLKNALN